MLEQLAGIRAAAKLAIEGLGIDVFAQRNLGEDELSGISRFSTLTLVRSDSEDDGSAELWRMPMNVGCYIENPASDDELEALAIQIKQALEAPNALPDIVNGIVYQGHQYPKEQGDDYAAIDIQFELILS